MFESSGIGLERALLWIAQIPPVVTPEGASVAISGPNFFIALIAGVLLAFAFQILLTNLGVAVGISILGGDSDDDSSSNSSSSSNSGSISRNIGGTARQVTTGLGLATLVTVTVSLFVACWMAVSLSLLTTRIGLGIIMGFVIWATYFSILFWVSSTTIGSFVGSVISAATSGFQALLGTATSAIGSATSAMGSIAAGNQAVNTAEAAARAVRRELTAGLDPQGIREQVEDYLETIRPPQVDYQSIQSQLGNLLQDPSLRQLTRADVGHINRQTFIDLVSSRSDLSSQEINRIVDQLERAWHGVVSQLPSRNRLEDFMDYVREASPDQLVGQEFTDKLGSLVDDLRHYLQGGAQQGQQIAGKALDTITPGQQDQQDQQSGGIVGKALDTITPGQGSSGLVNQAINLGLSSMGLGFLSGLVPGGQGSSSGIMSSAVSLGLTTLAGIVLNRQDLSDLDVEKVLGQLQEAKDQLTGQADKVQKQLSGEPSFSPVRADVENYLLHAYSWRMTRANLEREFRDVIYDAEANPNAVVSELEQLKKKDFRDLLQQRGVFTQDEITEITRWLEEIRLEAIATAKAASERGESVALLGMVENYLLAVPKDNLTPERIQLELKPVLADSNVESDILERRLAQFDASGFERILNQRQDLTPEEVSALIPELEKARDHALAESQELQEAAKAKVGAQWLKIQSYLRDTHLDELNPDGIQRDFQTLLDDPQAGMIALRARASQFDRDTLVQLLSEREELDEAQINAIIDQIESVWHDVRTTPGELVGIAKEQYNHAMNAISDYLRNTGKDELNPEGIKQDLQLLLDQPQLGIQALRMRLSEVDRDTLVQLLNQRDDLSEAQINQIINEVQTTLRSIARVPRRWASRATAQIMDFEASVEDYLRSTGKEELNPDAIKRDFQQLLRNPQVGLSNLGDRLSHLNQETIVQYLSQREDMAEHEITQVVNQVLSVRDYFVEQLRGVQRDIEWRIQTVVDGILNRIRDYLNSLNRPELNYEGVKRDMQQLFDDPEAGFDALRARLSQFDRDTLVAILGSSPYMSEADINGVIAQIETARNRVLQRAERIQQETERRIEQVKREAELAAEETRKTAATAAWWLFGTALVSGLASGLGGFLAVAFAWR